MDQQLSFPVCAPLPSAELGDHFSLFSVPFLFVGGALGLVLHLLVFYWTTFVYPHHQGEQALEDTSSGRVFHILTTNNHRAAKPEPIQQTLLPSSRETIELDPAPPVVSIKKVETNNEALGVLDVPALASRKSTESTVLSLDSDMALMIKELPPLDLVYPQNLQDEVVFDPRLRDKIAAARLRTSAKRYSGDRGAPNASTDIYGIEEIQSGDGRYCYKVTQATVPNDRGLVSLPSLCEGVKTQSEKMAEALENFRR